ncbi:unnamed protein product, partial [Caenorhabditis auriculariae]
MFVRGLLLVALVASANAGFFDDVK